MRPRTLIGLMFCTLFSLSTPAFAQTAQPVIQTAQAAQSDVTIPEGTTQEFDAAQGEIKFDGTLTNKGTIIITSSYPAQTEAVLRAVKLDNQGTIISRVPSLTIYTEKVYGAGEVTAPENIAIAAADKDLLIANGTYRAKYFRPSAERKLSINARRIDAQVDLKAYELSIGVREGNLDIVQQKVDGDPIYYNRGGDITAVMPGNGFDIYVLAAGNVNLSGVNAIGLNGEVRDFVVSAGLHFANGGGVDEGNSEFGCGGFGGVSCAQTIENNSGPGQIFEGAPGGPFEPSGTITINGAIARGISLSARDIVINGTLDARQDNTRPGSPSIILDAANSITVNAQLKTEATTDQLKEGFVALQAPTINVNSKITSDSVFIAAFENSVATTGSITTAAIEARTSYIYINAGHIQFEEVGGALLPSALPHDSGEFTIKTGKLTAHRYVMLSATGNIDAGNIELLPNEAPVPLGTHDVRIHANVGKEDAPPLKIGGGTNGAASITVQGTTDLGEGLTQKTGVIFLTNGPSGDIVLDGAKIHVTNEHNGTPSLIAYAGTGQVTVKGNIVFDGTATAPAGQILLVGDEIRSTGATISVKDTLADAVEKPAKVVLATSKITLAGDLTIEANSKAQTSIRVVPKGSITLDPQEHFEGLYHYVDKFPVNVTENEVLVNGSGNLTVKSKSDEAKVEITAKPLKFNSTGTSQIFATGTGSKINVDYPGSPTAQNSLVFNGGAVTFDTSNPNSDAGDINILADKVRNAADAVVALKANADTNGKGGNITVSMDRGTLTLGTEAGGMSFSALGKNGDGGTVAILNAHNNGRVTYQNLSTSAVIDVSATGDSGAGGTITLNVDQLTSDDTVAVAAALVDPPEADLFTLNGAGSDRGGSIVRTFKILSLPNKRISADGGPINGAGGLIDFTVTDGITLGTDENIKAVFSARGFGSGDGGRIHISNAPQVDLKFTSIVATGGESGIGGVVVVQNAKAFDVNGVIDVAGGELIGTTQFDGSITLNSVKCRQWKTGFDWPTAFWKCTNDDPPSIMDKVPASMATNLPGALKGLLANKVQIYVHQDEDNYNQYFDRTPEGGFGGETFKNVGFLYTYVSVLQTCDGCFTQDGPYTPTQDQFAEASIHELGHAVDFEQGLSVGSGSANYDLFVKQDYFYLDYAIRGDTPENSLRRDPCIAFQGVTAPFDDVIDQRDGLPICPFGQLRQELDGLSNSQIALLVQPDLFEKHSQGDWRELFAQTFAYQGFSNTVSLPLVLFADGVFGNAYFACTNAEALFILGGPAVYPTYCGLGVPTWYNPGNPLD